MKKIISVSLLVLSIFSCSGEYSVISQRVVRGIISAKEEGHIGRISTLPKFYVQSSKETVSIDVPFADENLFKVGDTICVVVKTVEKINN